LKFQKNSTERRKTNPTRTNSLEVVLRPPGIAVGFTDNTANILTNKRAKTSSNHGKRHGAGTATMKLEKPTNNNTKRILIPNETRRAAKPATIDSTEITSHYNISERTHR
jgi:hypothetical protein